jgi:malonate-semialdehyde dehydrogenase (acetylating)/methylmalonate-semialdehyde dehydrogenase
MTDNLIQGQPQKVKNFVNGNWVESCTEKYDEVPNPATGETMAYIPISTREDLDEAVAVAQEAFKTWKRMAVPKRARILFKYQQLLIENWEELARLVTIENGKS